MQIEPEKLSTPLQYSEYLKLLSEENILKMPEHLQAYTRLNAQRMHRWEKTYRPSAEAESAGRLNLSVRHAFILTEPWCGDAAHCIPAIHKLLSATHEISSIVYVLRDTNLDVMDRFLTNTKRSIPILILTDEKLHVLGTWGPRPNASQRIVDHARLMEGETDKWKEELQMWYNHNKQQDLELEYMELLQQCNSNSKNC